jgi:hypothetical protein
LELPPAYQIIPLLRRVLRYFFNNLAIALNRVAEVLQSWTDEAFGMPVLSEV